MLQLNKAMLGSRRQHLAAAPAESQLCNRLVVKVTLQPQKSICHHICFASSKDPQPSRTEDPNYDYSDPVNKFLGQFLPSNKAAKDELADKVDFDQPKLRGLGIKQMVGYQVFYTRPSQSFKQAAQCDQQATQ